LARGGVGEKGEKCENDKTNTQVAKQKQLAFLQLPSGTSHMTNAPGIFSSFFSIVFFFF
jgi:hypothetical protein